MIIGTITPAKHPALWPAPIALRDVVFEREDAWLSALSIPRQHCLARPLDAPSLKHLKEPKNIRHACWREWHDV
ncbi:hypothetical protein [Ensifer aridi]|uniref:hypothetical protein n=1 Tax=Ensifer aridi TaxID=1708715 RepID=UPI00111C2C2E|nr:hypothetical protein [Ensifer aridi]